MIRWGAAAGIAAGLAAVLGFVTATQCGCSPRADLTPKEEREIAATAAVIARCQLEGRAANSFRVFDACMVDAGAVGGSK